MPGDIPSLKNQIWLRDDETQKVMSALNDGATARFVGGCVRNALMSVPVEDVDIATSDEPATSTAKLEAAGFKVVPIGADHGTVMAVGAERSYEVTTLRVDMETDGRHADVAFTQDWQGDAERRDFTFNALYADADGTVHDPLGGHDDRKARRVRFIGDAETRIKEDYLRILRFFRFHAAYGEGDLDPESLQACAANRDGLAKLSAERIQTELFKLLGADNAVPVVRAMAAAGILGDVVPEASRLDRFERLLDIEVTQLISSDPDLRLGAIVDGAGAPTPAARLRLSNADRDRLTAMHTDDTKIVCYLSMREVRRALYNLGLQLFKDRVMLGWADDGKTTNAFQWRALLAMADSWERPELPLTGSMIMSAGGPEGPEIGRVRDEVEEWWIDSDFTEDEFSIIERLKAVEQATVY
ncbi:MAG: CCA tRNA nucleotidyltransferase [Candidatus Phaeomarinobacter sp.]